MARTPDRVDLSYSKRESKPARRGGRLRRMKFAAAGVGGILLLLLVAAPTLLSSGPLATAIINRFAGLQPLRVDIGSLSVGWLSPLQVEEVRILDAGGAEVARVGQLETQLSIWSLLSDATDLRHVYVRQVRLPIDVQPNTTSLEEAIRPLLASWALDETPADDDAEPMSLRGTIHLEDATVLARDSVTGEQWELAVAKAELPMLGPGQTMPELAAVGRIAQIDPAGNLVLRSTGQFSVRLEPLGEPAMPAADASSDSQIPRFRVAIQSSGLPLEWVNLVKRRCQWLPIERISGSATLTADVSVQAADSVVANITTAQIDRLAIDAPEFLGGRGAAIEQVRLEGDVRWANSRLESERLQLTSDVGFASGSASIPFPLESPTLIRPWVPDADLSLEAEIDLPRLIAVAPDMIPVRDQLRLQSGKAKIAVRHIRGTGSSAPQVRGDVSLGSLQAEYQGKTMRWDEAMQVSLDVHPPAAGGSSAAAEFSAECRAEFCNVQGRGTLAAGQIAADVDLDKLQQRLSQWVELPTQSFAGSMRTSAQWRQQDHERVAATATIDTTDIAIGLPGGQLRESAWKGEATAVLQLQGMELVQLDQFAVQLRSDAESLQLVTANPFRIAEPPAGSPPLPPTGVNLAATCDLAACVRRAEVFAGGPLGIELRGLCTVKADGRLEGSTVALETADYEVGGLTILTAGTRISENRLQGRFSGHLDPSAISATRIDELLVQAESFALTAQDAAADPASGALRSGTAAVRFDPQRLTQAITFEENGVVSDLGIVCTGEATGKLLWSLKSDSVDWQAGLDGKNIAIFFPETGSVAPRPTLVSTAAAPPAAEPVWSEPQVKIDGRGKYDFASGAVTIPQVTVQSEWLAFGGKTDYRSDSTGSLLKVDGQLTYDAESVTRRLRPWIGEIATVKGQRTEPLLIEWRTGPEGSGHWADTLTAKTIIGWQEAEIVGISLGEGAVPITVDRGLLQTAADIPVSQGRLRWDLRSNLAAEPLIVSQKPQLVLERVAITPQMCRGWLKYVTPLLADVASIQGQLSLDVEKAEIQPLDTLNQTASGRLMIYGATVGPGPLSDQLIGIARQIRAMRKGMTLDPATINEDLWVQMPEQQIAFTVDQGTITHRDVQFRVGDVAVTTSGGVTMDGRLQMMARVPIQQAWIEDNKVLAPLAGQSIDLPIKGTLQKPQVDFAGLTNVTQQLITAATQQAVQKQLDRGLNKLLGPLQNQIEPLQQQIQSLPQQLPALPQMPQMPQLPQLPNFGFGGFGAAPPAAAK